MKYRIKQTTDIEGSPIYVPQYKRFFIFWDYWDTNFPPHRIFFRSYSLADNFIQIQRTKPKDRFFLL